MGNKNSHLKHDDEQKQLENFWSTQQHEIENASDFRNSIPLTQIRKIMKADEGVCMISADVPVVFAKACELFIRELTLLSWLHALKNRRTGRPIIQASDINAVLNRNYDIRYVHDITYFNRLMSTRPH